MLNPESSSCIVCGSGLSAVGLLHDGADLTRILACENGHFIRVALPQEHAAWQDRADAVHLDRKLQEFFPDNLQDLWVRQGSTWTRASLDDVGPETLSFGVVNPCPFCGSTNTIVMWNTKQYFLYCDSCDVFGPEADSLADSIIKWNAT